ncbi:hypothetical protein [Enterococcus cecorum]|uniref:Uncharacterized protein n=1 Tax=Enterococcus cecorum TaxID=44008 RepID=A0A200HPF8_9ENTE|nr:hypothetical protein [Enterococcus cecorum]OUZ14662.1 hypothetical protein A5869_001760 [Enterococcus cecorum]
MTSGATQKYIKNKGYESISRAMLQNDDLSLEARGLLAYMESMPENYVFHKTQLQKAFKHNKRTCIDRIWNELMSQNYLIAFRKRDGKKYIYHYYFTQDKFDEEDIQAIESDLLSSGFERVPLIERKSRKAKTKSETLRNQPLSDDEIWDVDFEQSKMNCSKSAGNKLTINKLNTKIEDTRSKPVSKQENHSELMSDENLVATQKYPLLSEQSTELLSKFGKDGLKLISKIYESKRKVEKDLNAGVKIYGDIFSEELDAEVNKFIKTYRLGNWKEQGIKDMFGYFYKMMMNFWKKCLLTVIDNPALIYETETVRFNDYLDATLSNADIDSILRTSTHKFA